MDPHLRILIQLARIEAKAEAQLQLFPFSTVSPGGGNLEALKQKVAIAWEARIHARFVVLQDEFPEAGNELIDAASAALAEVDHYRQENGIL